MCTNSEIEDECHFLLICPFYDNFRKMYIKKYYYEKPSTYKLIQLLSTENVNLENTYVNVQKYEVKIFQNSEFILDLCFIAFCTYYNYFISHYYFICILCLCI
jgi:hypothetical protein